MGSRQGARRLAMVCARCSCARSRASSLSFARSRTTSSSSARRAASSAARRSSAAAQCAARCPAEPATRAMAFTRRTRSRSWMPWHRSLLLRLGSAGGPPRSVSSMARRKSRSVTLWSGGRVCLSVKPLGRASTTGSLKLARITATISAAPPSSPSPSGLRATRKRPPSPRYSSTKPSAPLSSTRPRRPRRLTLTPTRVKDAASSARSIRRSSSIGSPASACTGSAAVVRSVACASPYLRSRRVMSGAACPARRFTISERASALLPAASSSPLSRLNTSRPRPLLLPASGSKSTRTGRRHDGQRAWPLSLKAAASARSQQVRQ
mmetsp:Transcript_26385/g.66981  ORF Transcript_26385/g.66981 Transcript_26385/m.66981 type:complete len:323 (-) Transcript_26385:133-1101(-)